MLRELRVSNLVLIREASLQLAPGLNVLTGETGAGKTIVAQAVSLLLGGKTDAALVGPAGGEAYVEAAFADVPAELMPAGSAPTGARARSSSAGPVHAPTSRRWEPGCWRSSRSTRHAGSRAPPCSSICSTAPPTPGRLAHAWPRRTPPTSPRNASSRR
jgi:hypothetical protein